MANSCALNAVSAIAQIGQFGIAFMLLPLALENRHSDAIIIGSVSSALWIGNLTGLLIAPALIERVAIAQTVLLGLMKSGIALTLVPFLHSTVWILLAALTGFGYGLRWIANERGSSQTAWLMSISVWAGCSCNFHLHGWFIELASKLPQH
jgi:hypothetical protein